VTAAPHAVAAQMRSWASEIERGLEALAIGELSDINDGSGGVVFITGTPFHWSELPSHLHPLQSRLLEEYRRFAETLRVLLREQPEGRLDTFRDDRAAVLDFVNRSASGESTARRALSRAVAALHRQVDLIEGLYSAAAGTLLVPDTNALYWNPALEEWRVPWTATAFTLVLTPTVLKEIDRHKVDDRSSVRRAKAERLARQISEYGRRGSLLQGVPLVRAVSTVMAVAIEPRMPDSLPWLDATNDDDRLLASIVEVMRLNPLASVTVVTRDLNFQNKPEFARVPFVSPSDLDIAERQ
jgi:PIN domain-containing protein